jgi:hypothetical protein
MSDHPYTCDACGSQVDGRGHDRVCAAKIVVRAATKPRRSTAAAKSKRVKKTYAIELTMHEIIVMRDYIAESLRTDFVRDFEPRKNDADLMWKVCEEKLLRTMMHGDGK